MEQNTPLAHDTYHGVFVSGWGSPGCVLEPLESSIGLLDAVSVTSPGQLEAERTKDIGQQDDPLEPSLSTYAQALLGQLEEINPPVVLLGWSTGAMIALEAAARLPEKVCALVLISGTACFTYKKNCPWGVPANVISAMARQIKKKPEVVLDDFFRRATRPAPLETGEIDRKIDAALEQGSSSLYRTLLYLRDTNLEPLLPNIPQPSLLIHGKDDDIISCNASHHLHTHLARSATVRLADAGHNLPEQQPESLAIYIDQFLQGIGSE